MDQPFFNRDAGSYVQNMQDGMAGLGVGIICCFLFVCFSMGGFCVFLFLLRKGQHEEDPNLANKLGLTFSKNMAH